MLCTEREAMGLPNSREHPGKECRAIPIAIAPVEVKTSGLVAVASMPAGTLILGRSKCQGTSCMHWQWYDHDQPHMVDFERRGYCGLSGAPNAAAV